MKPISVHNAPEGKPFTVSLNGETVRDLFEALSSLIDMGYGGTSILTQEWDSGEIYRLSELRLFDTTEEQIEGVTLNDTAFFLC